MDLKEYRFKWIMGEIDGDPFPERKISDVNKVLIKKSLKRDIKLLRNDIHSLKRDIKLLKKEKGK